MGFLGKGTFVSSSRGKMYTERKRGLVSGNGMEKKDFLLQRRSLDSI